MTREIKTNSRLEKVLVSGAFAVTGELGPPRHANPHEVEEIAAGILAPKAGLEANMQMVCRDRNASPCSPTFWALMR
jgi:methylenetetrahydrofolate reductase (NADPH)